MQAPDTSRFLLRVGDFSRIDALLGLENGVNALGRNNRLSLVPKDEGGVLPVENHNIDLLAKRSLAIYHVRRSRLIPVRQVGFQQLQPYIFARISLCARMRKRFARRRKSLLDVIVKPTEKVGKRPIGHCLAPSMDSRKGGVGGCRSTTSLASSNVMGLEGYAASKSPGRSRCAKSE